ncbi:tRNA-dihydrouridine synthase [Patescibacteria group bacterium]|nr:MAG: tRNA-dihydrouridine synthase [Patescibacteria group bacterium]
MEKSFWKKLKKPFFVQAPMDDVTNFVFRQIVARCGRPHVEFTEFVSADGAAFAVGKENLIEKLKFSQSERPIVAQFFGAKADHFFEAAKWARELGFDGIDINMGCPDASVIKQGGGSALIRNPKLARKIIQATKAGAEHVPVSVKTRIGYSKNEVKTWIPEILAEEPAALTLHGRTANRGYAMPADWEAIKEAVQIAKGSGTVMIGNGDIYSLKQARFRARQSGVDGVMIGRALLKNPWVFNPKVKAEEISVPDRLKLLLEHVELFQQEYSQRNFSELKKYFAGYVSDFPGAKELRIKLMTVENEEDVRRIIAASGFLDIR